MPILIRRLARVMALLGGVVLCALVAMTCLSILGRALDGLAHDPTLTNRAPAFAAWLAATVGPVRGDYELIEAGIAFAIFAFLPICQLSSGHARVDLIAGALPARLNLALAAMWEAVLTAIIIVIGWRLSLGFVEKLGNGQTTFLLELPLWWAYGACVLAAGVAGLVGVFCTVLRLRAVWTGKDDLAPDGGAAS